MKKLTLVAILLLLPLFLACGGGGGGGGGSSNLGSAKHIKVFVDSDPEVASALGYSMDATITVAHGTRDDGLSRHAGLPFSVTGILARSGTPADRSLFVTLDAIEAIHVGWESGIRVAEVAQELGS